jgi:hypothetical protein
VPPLPIPQPGDNPAGLERFESVSLFAARAQTVAPHFAVTPDNAPAVAELCRRLDGLPLAIELAAARVRALSPQQILQRLTGRFDLLSRGSRTAPGRQQTLRGSVDRLFELCAKPERLLWARASVFVAGFELDAVEGVGADAKLTVGDLLDVVAGLVDKSILIRDTSGGETAGEPGRSGRSGVNSGRNHEPVPVLDRSGAAREGRARLEQALARPTQPTILRVKASFAHTVLAGMQGDPAAASTGARHAREIAADLGEPRAYAIAACADDALAQFRADVASTIWCVDVLAWIAFDRGRLERGGDAVGYGRAAHAGPGRSRRHPAGAGGASRAVPAAHPRRPRRTGPPGGLHPRRTNAPRRGDRARPGTTLGDDPGPPPRGCYTAETPDSNPRCCPRRPKRFGHRVLHQVEKPRLRRMKRLRGYVGPPGGSVFPAEDLHIPANP